MTQTCTSVVWTMVLNLIVESRGVASPADVNILDDGKRHLASYKAFDQAPFAS